MFRTIFAGLVIYVGGTYVIRKIDDGTATKVFQKLKSAFAEEKQA